MDEIKETAPFLRVVGADAAPVVFSQADQSVTPKHKSPFKQANLVRAVRAAQAAGLPVVATIIAPDGTIRLEHVGAPADSAPTNLFDRWEAKRARAA
jgi:L-asparaginase/Glu-tRNA(Gln) amidotransferase subunit D